MPPLAPVLTQIVPQSDVAIAGTEVATIAQPPEEVDPGPFTYSELTDPAGMYDVSADKVLASVDLDGAFYIGVVATSAAGDSPEGGATLIFADNQSAWDDSGDPYYGNSQLPPPTPAEERWRAFLRRAVNEIVPRARYGVDYVVVRPTGKSSGQEVIDWNDTLLGAYPQAEVEAHAQVLSDAQPWSEPQP